MLKKVVTILFFFILLLILIPQTASGANRVTDINVDVVIYDDGSAYITQTWNGNFSEGTEGYIPIENLGEMSIADFLVSDVNGAYTYLDAWDIDASFEEKRGKCGIVETGKGYELCWGISEYGERRYAIEYKINNLVGGYQDVEGFNFQFINSGMGTLPTDVTVKIILQNGTRLDENNAGIWAFGFDGQITFEDGQVVAYTESPLSSNTESVIIMLQLNKGLINPTRVEEEFFEVVKEEALKGSDYNYDSGSQSDSVVGTEEFEWGFIDYVMLILITAGSFLPLGAYYYFKKRKKKIRNTSKNVEYFREVPIAGNIEATFVLAKLFQQINDDGNLIGAAFLKLINEGCLEPMTEKNVGFFGKEKESISLKLVKPPEFSGVAANMLYSLLILVSGKDQILQEKELENYCTKNYSAMLRIVDAAKQDGENTLEQIGSYDPSKKANRIVLSPRGEKLLLSILGFKKYLLEFSLIGERTIAESVIWQDYLTFATLLGIADKVIEQLEKVYPNVTEYSQNAHYYYMLSRRYTRVSYNAAQTARSAGSGGRSSFGGGGGFSGGGSGGGTR